jgi:hypothetical protein
MKIQFFILCLIFVGCATPKTENPKEILSENSFTDLLKDIHLAEAQYEMRKTKGMENAKSELSHNYNAVYETHAITADDFNKTLDYYAQHPEKLEKIYTNVLEQLTGERSTLDQQETN